MTFALARPPKYKVKAPEVGDKYGHLEVVADLGVHEITSKRLVRVQCNACPERTVKIAYLYALQSGGTVACGCVGRARTRERHQRALEAKRALGVGI